MSTISKTAFAVAQGISSDCDCGECVKVRARLVQSAIDKETAVFRAQKEALVASNEQLLAEVNRLRIQTLNPLE